MNLPDFVIEYLENPSTLSAVKRKMAEEWINRNKDSVNKYLIERGYTVTANKEYPQFQDYLAYKKDRERFKNSPYYNDEESLKRDVEKGEGIELTESPVDFVISFASPKTLLSLTTKSAQAAKPLVSKTAKEIKEKLINDLNLFIDKKLSKEPNIDIKELENIINSRLSQNGYPLKSLVSKRGANYDIVIEKLDKTDKPGVVILYPNYYKKTGLGFIDKKIAGIDTSTNSSSFLGHEGFRKTYDFPKVQEYRGAAATIHNSINDYLKSNKLGNLLSGGTGHSEKGFKRWEKLVQKGIAERIKNYDDLDEAMHFNTYKLKKKGGWIEKAIKKPGSLTKQAKREGLTISEFCKKDNLKLTTKRRCDLAKTLRNMKYQDGNVLYDDKTKEIDRLINMIKKVNKGELPPGFRGEKKKNLLML